MEKLHKKHADIAEEIIPLLFLWDKLQKNIEILLNNKQN
ncbi:hypothetical protein Thexy_0105 [Thermoanaerobacterium xylanolyticum LX-11]|uniref:Uncharacterized protein n=1 Tax=Thermoanaerobacterium xylanolyticum (strain ATCC 49914 / DSM 7097 / LX-11) TaxID=858215 RepID=F6BF90_THEXL|nr:hypothetical protein Thexy_0105 [Thermoanaerobacterium xylanolyticum LX-11]